MGRRICATKGLLARTRKAAGSLIPPSFNHTKLLKTLWPEPYDILQITLFCTIADRNRALCLFSTYQIMETETENKKHEWKNSISSASSSRSSSITSESSDGHFDIRHFPLPKPSLSASEAQKQRESHQAYNSSVSSYTTSSWSSIHQNHLVDLPSYDPNRIPSSVFSSKPANSTEWSMASNESLFSIHDGNFGFSTRDDHGLAAPLRVAEIPRSEEPIHQVNEIKLVPPPPPPSTKKPNESEKETTAEDEPYQMEKSDYEIDDDEEEEEEIEGIIKLESDNEHEEEGKKGEEIIEEQVSVDIEMKTLKEKQEAQVVKENKPEDSNSIVSHSPSISCRSDTSNNSIGSFAFPVLQKDAVIKTPSIYIKTNVSNKRRTDYQSPMLLPKPQPQHDAESSMLTQLQPQRKASKQFESPKALKGGWFSCFHCPSKCSLFK